jgi:DNA mismatch repair protein MutS
MILEEYLKIYKTYSEKYGEKTALLMQVGSFFEVYGVDNGIDKFGNAEELSRILNIVLTRKSKKILSNSMQNPLMLGFPCVALSKYVPVLLEEDYTVVVVEQVKVSKSSSNSFIRKVVDVISPSTYIEGNVNNDNYLVVLYTDKHKHVGMSAISLLTGNSVVHECYSDPNDVSKAFDDALSFIKQYRPREVVIGTNSKKGKSEHLVATAQSNSYSYSYFSFTDTLSYLEIDQNEVLCHDYFVANLKYNIAYQEAVLGSAFDSKLKLKSQSSTMISNIECLNLERSPYALMSYVLLIEFVHAHNPMLLRKISHPDIWCSSYNLTLSTSTIDQLNITDIHKHKYPAKRTYNFSNLFDLVNKCSTNVGTRLLKARLLSPTSNTDILNKRYDQIEQFGMFSREEHTEIEKILDKIIDIERLLRRMNIGILSPPELAALNTSYRLVFKLHEIVNGRMTNIILHESKCSQLREFMSVCESVFNIEELLTNNADTVRFKTGTFANLDTLLDRIQEEKKDVFELANLISACTGCTVDIEYAQNYGYYVAVSNTQVKKLKNVENIDIKHNKTSAKATSSKVDAANKNILMLNEKLKTLTHKRYKQVLQLLSSEYSDLVSVTKFVSEVDVIKSNYCRPQIESNTAKNDIQSFVNVKDLRHPIIEQIDDGNVYVPNDVDIGVKHNGIILYSMNSCGKTSLMKSFGLSVIMAQSGCFVPASSFSFYPFKCIMTRILSRDNFMKGQSSFVAEMSELRAILKRATGPSTLVLADEITHGTEHTSGSAIFVSSVETLAKRNVNFMFTTHLHNVYPFVRDIPNVRTFHLSVKFKEDDIVFERKLKDGPGGSIYGLEVCEHLNMDTELLARAFQLRNIITPDKADTEICIDKMTPTKYNRNKIKNVCEMCGYCPRLPTDSPLDTHHIKHQAEADENGIIDGTSVHAKSNLKVLCKKCHSIQHAKP